jgi:hypothetical protein
VIVYGTLRPSRFGERALAKKPLKSTNHQQKTTATYDSQTAQSNASKEQTQYDNPAHEHRTNKRNLAIIPPPILHFNNPHKPAILKRINQEIQLLTHTNTPTRTITSQNAQTRLFSQC